MSAVIPPSPNGPDQDADQDEADDRGDPEPREDRNDDSRRAEDDQGVAGSRELKAWFIAVP